VSFFTPSLLTSSSSSGDIIIPMDRA